MVNFERELPLRGNGPTNEELHDCNRLGPKINELKVIDFWYQEDFMHEGKRGSSGGSLPIEIEGVHRARNDGREWFFWGKLKQITSGSKWVPAWEAKTVCFVFGRWNTYHHRGKIKFSSTSFFASPLTKGLDVDPEFPTHETEDERRNALQT